MDSFTVLVHRHRQRVIRFLFRMSWDREKAEDGAQEVFLRLWMARSRYVPSARFSTFIYQVARNYCRDEARRACARPAEVPLETNEDWNLGRLPLLAPAALEPQHQALARYQQWRIREAIRSLPEIYRAVFVLAHLEDRKLSEVAEILEIPVGTVKSRMHTAIRLLRERLAREE